MRRRSVLTARALVLCVLWALVATVSADEVDDRVLAVMEQQHIPGLSLAIIRDGVPVKIQGYGLANVELGVPASADTIFQTGSVAKQFTAAGILLLAEEGKLKLDDPLALHFPTAPAAWHRIRVRHLLTHTSGLKDYDEDDIDFRRDYTEDELLKIVMGLPLEFEPGTQWSYSNSGYVVLGILTSKLTGMHWSEFQKQRIFEPLGMTTARVISESDIVANRADGYELTEEGSLRNQEWVSPTLNYIADGAIYVTVRDMMAWDAALRARRLLSSAAYDAWWTPVSLGDDTSYPYGFGWFLDEQRGRPLIEHGGSWQGFRTEIARYVEDGLTVIVLANLASARPETLAHEIAGIVDNRLLLPDPDIPVADPDPRRTARLEGVLWAWSEWRTTEEMGHGLTATATGSTQEAMDRRRTAKRLAEHTRFAWIGEDNLRSHPIDRRGETVTTIAYCALSTAENRYVYRFYLTADGRVADFSSEQR